MMQVAGLSGNYRSSESNIYESSTYIGKADRYTFRLRVFDEYDYSNDSYSYCTMREFDVYYKTEDEANIERQKYMSRQYNVIEPPRTDSDGDTYQHKIEWSVLTTVSPVSMEVYKDVTKSLTSSDKQFNLGAGWSFDLPYIEMRDGYNYLHYGSAGTWQIDMTTEAGGNTHLVNYKLNDYKLTEDSGYYNEQMASKYVLTEKSGKKTYFGSDGRLLGIVDRFGNEILFQHSMIQLSEIDSRYSTSSTNQYPMITKVIDSVGRIVNISYTDSAVTVTVEDKSDSQNNKVITYNKTQFSGITGEYVLDNVVDPEKRQTKYAYERKTAWISFVEKNSSKGLNNDKACLTKICYPTGGETVYNYEKYTKNCGNDGSMDAYKVFERADYKKDTSRYNYAKYNYKYNNSPEYDGYPNSLDIITDQNPVITMVEDDLQNNQLYTFTCIGNDNKNKNLLLKSILSREGSTNIKETINEYDPLTKLIIKTTNKLYNGSQSLNMIECFQYDAGGFRNIINYWDIQANGDKNDTGHKTTYTYDTGEGCYNLLLTKSYKKDADTYIQEENTVSADHKTIQSSFVKEKKGNGDYLIQSKTGYEYDLYGNVAKQKNYLKKYLPDGVTPDWDSSFIETGYDYTDNNGDENRDENRDFSGAYLTRKFNTGIKDADGNLIASMQGEEAGTVVEAYKYDWFGNMVEKQDGEGNLTTYEYDKLRRLTKQINPDDTFKTWDYVSNTNENYVLAKDENCNSDDYSGYGSQAKSIFDELGNLVCEQVYAKDESQQYQFNSVVQYSYDSQSRLDWEKNLTSGALTDYTCYNDGRLKEKKVTDTNNSGTLLSAESYTYEDAVENGTLAKITKTVTADVYSQTTVTDAVYAYQTSVTYIDKIGKVERQERLHQTEDGTVKTYKDTFVYDYLGNKIEEKIARAYDKPEMYTNCNWTGRYEYNCFGKVIESYNVLGNHMTTEYDALGRVVSVTDYKGNNAQTRYSTIYEYDNLGRVLVEKTPFDSPSSYSVKKHYYDLNGNITQEMVSNNTPGAATETFSKTTYEYNNRNMLMKVTTYDNGSPENYTQYYYDTSGNKIRMFTGLSAPLDIYGPDNVSDTGDSEYSTTKYEYNELGKLARMTDPLDKSEAYKYDLNGNMTEKTDRNGNVTSLTYDGLGRNMSRTVTTPDGTGNAAYSYTYNFAGNRLSDSIGGATDSTCKYDDLGRLISRTEANGITMDYTYDSNNNRKSLVIKQNGTVITNTTYDYDTMNRLWHVYEGGQLLATYTYDVNGNREKLEYTNGNSTSYTYNLANKITELINLNGTAEELSHFDYTYYLDGNQESKNDAVTDIISTYTYDGLGRLVGETETSGGRTASTIAYTYDDSNNRMTMDKTTFAPTITTITSYSYDTANRLIAETRTTDGISEVTGYKYDNNGNQLTKTVNSVNILSNVYDGFNQLKSTTSDNKTSTYTYNADGLRTGKTVDGAVTSHIWDGQDIVLELDSAGAITSRYIRGINLIAYDKNGVVKYYLFNAHGDVVHLTDSTGNAVMDYRYDAFGNRKTKYGDVDGDGSINSSDNAFITRIILGMVDEFQAKDGFIAADVNGDGAVDSLDMELVRECIMGTITYFPADSNCDGFAQDDETHANYRDENVFRYCGEYFDKETGTIYLRARYYDPEIGRFITEDSYWGKNSDPLSLNLYTYCQNDPIQYYDPSGHVIDIIADIGFIIWDIGDIISDPGNGWNWAALGADAGCTVVPFATGGGRAVKLSAKGVELANKARKVDQAMEIAKAFAKLDKTTRLNNINNITASYKHLKVMAKGLGLEVHHLIEKRFAEKLGLKADDIFSIAIDKATHNKITQLFREKIKYNNFLDFLNPDRLTTDRATPQQVWTTIKEVYTKVGMEKYLEIIKRQMQMSKVADEITKW